MRMRRRMRMMRESEDKKGNKTKKQETQIKKTYETQ